MIIKGVRAMIIDSYLLLIIWAKVFTIMAYIKNRLPILLTIQQSTITPFQARNHDAQLILDYLRIFGSTTYILNET